MDGHETSRTHFQNSRFNIGGLLALVFILGLVVASISVYLMFHSYRVNVIRDVARDEGEHIAQLVYDHLYSVMRKGVTRQEVDELLTQVQLSLPGYSIAIIRGEPVAHQFGPRLEQAGLIEQDTSLQQVIQDGKKLSLGENGLLRYLLPLNSEPDCLACHTGSQPGEVNGVVDVRVPLTRLEAPVTDLAYPIMLLVLSLQAIFFGLIYLILRSWVSRPIQQLAQDVSMITQEREYTHQIHVGKVWPLEVKTLALNFSHMMRKIRQSHQELKQLSLHDPLTALYNRRYFDEALASALADSAESGQRSFALLLIDLDGFKPINDTYGHATGDALLVTIGQALTGAMRESDVAARLGGDEFAVLAFLKHAEETGPLIQRLRDAIETCSIRAGDTRIHPACSIGCVFHDAGAFGDATTLLSAADTVMYADKKARLADTRTAGLRSRVSYSE